MTTTSPAPVAPTPISTPPALKPGGSTSEGLLTLLFTLLNAAIANPWVTSVPTLYKAISMAIAGMTIIGYGAMRTSLKKAHIAAGGLTPVPGSPGSGAVSKAIGAAAAAGLVLFALSMFGACTHAQVVAAENAAEACGIATGKGLLETVADDLASAGLAAAEAALGSDAALTGLSADALDCLIKVVVAAQGTAGAGSGSAIATAALSPRSATIVANGTAILAKRQAAAKAKQP